MPRSGHVISKEAGKKRISCTVLITTVNYLSSVSSKCFSLFLCMTSKVRIVREMFKLPPEGTCNYEHFAVKNSTWCPHWALRAQVCLRRDQWRFVGLRRVLKGRFGRASECSAGALLTPSNSQKVPPNQLLIKLWMHRVQEWMSGQLCRLTKSTKSKKLHLARWGWWGCFWDANGCRPE